MMKTILAQTLLFTGVSIFPAAAGNQVLLRNLNSADGTPRILAAGGKSQLFVISTLVSDTVQQISRVVELDPNGSRLVSLDLPQMAYPAAAVTNAQGDLIVVGQDQTLQGIVLKLDSQLHNAATLTSLPATIQAVAADGSGNIYLTGITSSASFPVTAGAYQTKPPATGSLGKPAYAYVTKVSPAGQVVYSTYFGSDTASCAGGSYCVGKYGITNGTAIAVDASGAVVISGNTTANGLPTTAGAFEPTCVCGYDFGHGTTTAGFVAKFQPGSAQQLQWSTFLNASNGFVSVTVNAIALDSLGNVIVGGSAPPGLPATVGAFQVPSAGTDPNDGFSEAFLLKLNNTGAAALWGAYFGSHISSVYAVLVDAQKRVVFSGYVGDPLDRESQYRPTYVGRATSDGTALTDFYQGPETYSLVGPTLATTPTGEFAAVGQNGALWIETAAPGPSLLNITNSASGLYYASVSSVELITLYGTGIGPQTPLNGQVQNGAYTSSLGGYQVLFDGVAAPLLYVDSGQMNAIVPHMGATSTHVQVVTPTGTIDGPMLALNRSPLIGIFQNTQTGLAAALNQDGAINSASNPARSGQIVTVFAAADSGNYFPDGTLVPIGIYNSGVAVWVLTVNRSLEVVFAGNAPGLVAGVMQINFRLPNPLPAGNTFAFTVEIGGVSTTQGNIAVAT
jgi:uncharacterized protein (TIGR03437 family)